MNREPYDWKKSGKGKNGKKSSGKSKEELLAELEDAFDDVDDVDRVLELSNELIARFPDDDECLRLHAIALNLTGDLDDAIEFCGQALDAHPESLGLIQQAVELMIQANEADGSSEILEEALALIDRGCRMGEAKALEAVKAGQLPEADADLLQLEQALSDLYLQATDVYTLLGDPEKALEAADKAKALFPLDPEVLTNRGAALFELCRFEEAKSELQNAVEVGDEDTIAWGQYNLGLVMDHLGDRAVADDLIEQANERDPQLCPSQVKVSEKAFDDAVEQAITTLPSKVKDYLKNVAILVEPLPTLEDLTQERPPLSPNSLGLFRGTPAPQQSLSDPWSTFPSSIVLYQRNLERFVQTPEELSDEIRITLLHEVGHFLGLNEEEVAELGLR